MQSYQVYVCRGVTCSSWFADDVFREFGRYVRRLDLGDRVDLDRGGCYDRCGGGVTVVVRCTGAEEVVYPEVLEPEVGRIAREHLQGGEPVAELCLARRGAKPPPAPTGAAP
jgi:(2Fe-2S) ferredoxin